MTLYDARRLQPGDHVVYKRDKRVNHGQVMFCEHNILDIDWDDDSNTTVDLNKGDNILNHIKLKHRESELGSGLIVMNR